MSEIAAEPQREVQYEGHVLRIDDYNDPYSTPVPSFKASCEGSYVIYKEGTAFQAEGGEEGIEADVFHVAYLRSIERGMGTLLMKFALEEGIRRGFKRARMDIYNPRIVSIVKKLSEDIIKQATYFQDHSRHRDLSWAELVETIPTITAAAAAEYLESFEADENGYQDDGVVECLVELQTDVVSHHEPIQSH